MAILRSALLLLPLLARAHSQQDHRPRAAAAGWRGGGSSSWRVSGSDDGGGHHGHTSSHSTWPEASPPLLWEGSARGPDAASSSSTSSTSSWQERFGRWRESQSRFTASGDFGPPPPFEASSRQDRVHGAGWQGHGRVQGQSGLSVDQTAAVRSFLRGTLGADWQGHRGGVRGPENPPPPSAPGGWQQQQQRDRHRQGTGWQGQGGPHGWGGGGGGGELPLYHVGKCNHSYPFRPIDFDLNDLSNQGKGYWVFKSAPNTYEHRNLDWAYLHSGHAHGHAHGQHTIAVYAQLRGEEVKLALKLEASEYGGSDGYATATSVSDSRDTRFRIYFVEFKYDRYLYLHICGENVDDIGVDYRYVVSAGCRLTTGERLWLSWLDGAIGFRGPPMMMV